MSKGGFSVSSWAERKLGAHYKFDLPIFRGEAPVSPGDSGAYRIRNPVTAFLARRIGALRVCEWHRFGNSVKQLRNVFHAANALGVDTIHFVEEHPFFTGTGRGQPKLIWGGEERFPLAPTIEGSFFHLNALGLAPTPEDTFRILKDCIRPLVAPRIREGDPRVRDRDLVLHFRSGDAFSTPELARNHGQPPLSYYLSAVDQEQPERVWLAYEDRNNPCVEAAEAELSSRGLEVIMQSGTLADDLRLLMSARRLVAGRGSFVYWIAHLSTKLKRAYFLQKRGRMRSLRHLGVEVILAEDANGQFEGEVLKGNWQNSPQQRELMLTYPAEKLTFSILKIRSPEQFKKTKNAKGLNQL